MLLLNTFEIVEFGNLLNSVAFLLGFCLGIFLFCNLLKNKNSKSGTSLILQLSFVFIYLKPFMKN